jgi:hypothetical protein
MFCVRKSCEYHLNKNTNEECDSCIQDSNYVPQNLAQPDAYSLLADVRAMKREEHKYDDEFTSGVTYGYNEAIDDIIKKLASISANMSRRVSEKDLLFIKKSIQDNLKAWNYKNEPDLLRAYEIIDNFLKNIDAEHVG